MAAHSGLRAGMLRIVLLLGMGLLSVAFLPGQVTESPLTSGPSGQRIKPGTLRPELEFSLDVHGDRMRRPGKERMLVIGTIGRQSGSGQFQLVQELAGLMRLDFQQGGAGTQTIGVDANGPWKSGGTLQKDDWDLIEAVLLNTPERFFSIQAAGAPVRKLGPNFRIDGQTGTPYSGPSYDVYVAVDQVPTADGTKSLPKYFLVNSNSLLVEQIQYRDVAAGNVSVQTILSDWLKIDGNQVPRTIQRLEDGVEVLRVTAASVMFTAAKPDNAFNRN